VSPHHESHCNNLEHHFHRVNDQKYIVNEVSLLRDDFDFFVNSQEEAVDDDHDKDEPIEPRVDSHELNHFVSEGVRYREAAQWHCGIVLLIRILAANIDVSSGVSRKGISHALHLLVSELAQREPSDVLNLSHLLLEALPVKLFSFLGVRKVYILKIIRLIMRSIYN
jgi:hypothetical protein